METRMSGSLAIKLAIKEDVFLTVAIEMERLFSVVSNHYEPQCQEYVQLAAAIETEIKASLKRLQASELPT